MLGSMLAIGAFALALLLISFFGIRYRIPPFLLLIGAALFYGVLAGVPPDHIVPAITSGAGGIFAILGIVVFSGAVIAAALERGGALEYMVEDLRRISSRPHWTATLAGYLLSVPLMCCFTTYIVLHPLVSCLQKEAGKSLLYLMAIGSVLSFVLIYPSPVMVGMIQTLSLPMDSPYSIDYLTLPLSLALVILICLLARPIPSSEQSCAPGKGPGRLHSWAPILVILGFILAGLLIPALRLLANVNLALLAGMITALLLVSSSVRTDALGSGAKRAGVIIFDLAAAGAFGAVIGASTFSAEIFPFLSSFVPFAVIPFLLAVLLQTAQGSRTVTAIVTAQILAASGMVAQFHPISLVLMIAAGTLVVSYLSDPYFWLIQRTTGDEPKEVVRRFTIPLAAIGGVLFSIAFFIPLIIP
jgi:GntP family gluconate:H+ symporter